MSERLSIHHHGPIDNSVRDAKIYALSKQPGMTLRLIGKRFVLSHVTVRAIIEQQRGKA